MKGQASYIDGWSKHNKNADLNEARMSRFESGHFAKPKRNNLDHKYKVVTLENSKIRKIKPSSSVLPKGKYFVGIQRRFDPFEQLMKKVVD